jgi:hypothetical protein
VNYGRPLEVAQARAEAAMTKESARQLQSSASFKVEQKKAAMSAAESRIQEAASQLALAQQQLARTEVRADVPGIVVYPDVFFRLGTAQAASGRSGVGQSAAADPARHLEDGGGKPGARDGHHKVSRRIKRGEWST